MLVIILLDVQIGRSVAFKVIDFVQLLIELGLGSSRLYLLFLMLLQLRKAKMFFGTTTELTRDKAGHCFSLLI